MEHELKTWIEPYRDDDDDEQKPAPTTPDPVPSQEELPPWDELAKSLIDSSLSDRWNLEARLECRERQLLAAQRTIAKLEGELRQLKDDYDHGIGVEVARAERAESSNAALLAKIARLEAK